MVYELAEKKDLQDIYNVVQQTIKAIYPKYYPAEVVNFSVNFTTGKQSCRISVMDM